MVPRLSTPWQDTISPERTGWRQRAATLDGQYACAVDYRVCRTCRAGWVEQPYTSEEYQRCGLAAAGLTALRVEHRPDLAHPRRSLPGSRAFWAAAGADVPGHYQQREASCR